MVLLAWRGPPLCPKTRPQSASTRPLRLTAGRWTSPGHDVPGARGKVDPDRSHAAGHIRQGEVAPAGYDAGMRAWLLTATIVLSSGALAQTASSKTPDAATCMRMVAPSLEALMLALTPEVW